MAVYSQCFGVSALVAPWLAGVLIDANKNAVMLWLISGFLCILATPLTRRINTNQRFD